LLELEVEGCRANRMAKRNLPWGKYRGKFMNFAIFLWLFMAFYGFLWLFMAFYGVVGTL
jgi:hypothetical protein